MTAPGPVPTLAPSGATTATTATTTVMERLTSLATDHPEHPAVECGEERVTYAQLWARTGAAATALAAASPPGVPLGVWAPPGSLDGLVALLGGLAARRPVLALAPEAPDELLRRWLAAAAADLVVTTGDVTTDVSARTGRRCLTLASVVGRPPAEGTAPTGDDPGSPTPSDGAFLAPTPDHDHPVRWSDHAAVAAQAVADACAVGLEAGDRIAVLAPLSSVAGRRAVLAGLAAGATVLLRDATAARAVDLPAWLERGSATVVAGTSTLVTLVDAAGDLHARALPVVRSVLLLEEAGALRGPRPVVREAANADVVGSPEVAALPAVAAATDAAVSGRTTVSVRTDETHEPGDPLEGALVAIWEELLGMRPVPRDRDFFDLGGYSLLAARMLVLLEQRTGVRLPMAVFLEATTIAELAGAASAAQASPVHPLLVPLQAGDGTSPPLFLTHDLQGSAWRFRPLAEAVGADQAVYGFESPLLEGRSDFPTIEALAAHYVEAVRTVQAQGPYHLAGYSFGGILAFEMARILRAGGDEVALLGVIDVGPGYRGLDYSRTREPPLPYLRDAVEREGGHLPPWAAPVRRLWLNRWVLPWRWQRAAAHGDAVPADQRLWFAWWSHWHLVGPEWAPSPYDGRIDLFWAETTLGTDATMGWGAPAAEVEVHAVPGRHETLMEPPSVDHIGAGLRTRLRAEPAPR